MIADIRRVALFVAYLVVLFSGLALMPLALAVRRAGFRLDGPGRAVKSVGRACDEAGRRV